MTDSEKEKFMKEYGIVDEGDIVGSEDLEADNQEEQED